MEFIYLGFLIVCFSAILGMIIFNWGWMKGFDDCEKLTFAVIKEIHERIRRGAKGATSEPPRIDPITGEIVT